MPAAVGNVPARTGQQLARPDTDEIAILEVTPDPEQLRGRAKRALRRYFEKRRSPRAMLSLVILLTGLAGFVISYSLLRAGLNAMWMRYPLTIFLAYAVFLGLVRLWVEFEKRKVDPDDPALNALLEEDDEPEPVARSTGDNSWLDWLDIPSGLDAEGCLPMLLIGSILGLLAILISVIGAAPVLIAEVFLDVALAGLLYRRLRVAESEHWLGTAIRKTWLHVVGAAVLLSLAGACLDVMAPQSNSMGKAVKELLEQGRTRN